MMYTGVERVVLAFIRESAEISVAQQNLVTKLGMILEGIMSKFRVPSTVDAQVRKLIGVCELYKTKIEDTRSVTSLVNHLTAALDKSEIEDSHKGMVALSGFITGMRMAQLSMGLPWPDKVNSSISSLEGVLGKEKADDEMTIRAKYNRYIEQIKKLISSPGRSESGPRSKGGELSEHEKQLELLRQRVVFKDKVLPHVLKALAKDPELSYFNRQRAWQQDTLTSLFRKNLRGDPQRTVLRLFNILGYKWNGKAVIKKSEAEALRQETKTEAPKTEAPKPVSKSRTPKPVPKSRTPKPAP